MAEDTETSEAEEPTDKEGEAAVEEKTKELEEKEE